MNEKNGLPVGQDTAGFEPMIFEKHNWTHEEKQRLFSMCFTTMKIGELAECFMCTEQEILEQIAEMNLFWYYDNPEMVLFCVPSTREIFPATSPYLSIFFESTPGIC